MHDDDEFLRSIPPFLRRYHESPPRKLPIRPRDLPKPTAATATPAPVPAPKRKPTAPAAQRARIALAFENREIPETQDTAEGKDGEDGEDVTFQIALPRGVVHQISMLAVKRDTTQRAVVLRALRLAGISVPDGSDIDQPSHDAKRQA